MISKLQDALALLGRILLSLLFITAGYAKLTNFGGTAGYIASHGLPFPPLAAAVAICVELGGGLAILLGVGTRFVALAMAVFSVVTAVFFHNYWALPADQVANMQIHFWKNVSIAGGFLSLAAFGAGAFSVDAKLAR